MKRIILFYSALLLAEIILAVVCGPYSCEWGNRVYLSAGLAAGLLSFFLPFRQKEGLPKKGIGTALLFLLGALVVWCAGFLLGDFRLLCRLF